MKPEDKIQKLINESNVTVNSEADKRILAGALEYIEKLKQKNLHTTQLNIWKIIIKSRITKLVAAAVIAIAVLGGITFWPDSGPDNGKWWLSPPAAWSQEIILALENVEALVYRQRHAKVHDYGPTEIATGWEKCYHAKDAYRRDRYDWREGKTVVNTKWILRDGEAAREYEVSFEYQCYFERSIQWLPFLDDRMKELRRYVSLLSKADRILGTKTFDGRECIGFEISDDKYGSDSKGKFDRIWFDVETKLPLRIEGHDLSGSGVHRGQTLISIDDQFEYYAQIPMDMFTYKIPEGFVNAHPDEIQRQRKGEMIYGSVPVELEDEIVAALKKVKIGKSSWRHREGYKHVSFWSQQAWRMDSYSGDELTLTSWYLTQKVVGQNPDSAIADMVVETRVNHRNKTYKIVMHEDKLPWNPMDDILFKIGFVDRADRILKDQQINGKKCFEVVISSKKYGDTTTMFDRWWFDVDTKLPVRWELVQIEGQTINEVREFEWDMELPDSPIVPKIPDGFVLINPDGTINP